MKNLQKLLIALALLSGFNYSAYAQSDVIKQGIELQKQGKYAEAIAQYNEALKTDPENEYANYQIAVSLNSAKRPNEAIPHLDKAAKSTNTAISVAAYTLLAAIYDTRNDHQKAIDTYNTAIGINPNYPQIYYNLAIAQFGNQQYAEAELSAIEAIKKNPEHAGSQRLYALVTFHQNKRVNALLGFCSFILLEPTGPRAAEAYGNIQHIIQGGVLVDGKGKNTAPLSAADQKLNQAITTAVQAGKAKHLTGNDLLAYQLKLIFTLAGETSAKQTGQTFYDHFFAAYFYKLAQSDNMPAFTRTITLSDKVLNSSSWAKEQPAQLTALNDWIKATPREF